MSDPTVDLTAPVVPADFVPSNDQQQQQQQQPGADLFNYFLGNEQQQQQPMYNAPTMPSTLSTSPQQQATVSLQQQQPPPTPSNVTQQQPPSNDSTTIAPCGSPNGKVSNSSKCAGDACSHEDDQGGVIGFDAPTELTFEKQAERDQHDDEDYLSETQLKMMTSKERRQLRNKISARKFRNRRKGKWMNEQKE